jgi:hypothetical protein
MLKRYDSWNARSGLTFPPVVFLASGAILWVNLARGKELQYVLPLGVLAVLSLSAFVFWCFRLLWTGKDREALFLVVGYASYAVGALSLFALIVVSLVGVLNTMPVGIRSLDFAPDLKYWVFLGWAFLEGIHHYLYKLLFGRSDTLAHVVRTRNWSYVGKPLGGAIGIQLKRLRRRRRESLRTCEGKSA